MGSIIGFHVWTWHEQTRFDWTNTTTFPQNTACAAGWLAGWLAGLGWPWRLLA
jgi:hypothetical protein